MMQYYMQIDFPLSICNHIYSFACAYRYEPINLLASDKINIYAHWKINDSIRICVVNATLQLDWEPIWNPMNWFNNVHIFYFTIKLISMFFHVEKEIWMNHMKCTWKVRCNNFSLKKLSVTTLAYKLNKLSVTTNWIQFWSRNWKFRIWLMVVCLLSSFSFATELMMTKFQNFALFHIDFNFESFDPMSFSCHIAKIV